MEDKKIAEPDYDFKLEELQGSNLTDKLLLSNEVLFIKCTSGRAEISINSEIHEFATETNFVLSTGMIFQIVEYSDDFKITVLRFSSNFFNQIYPMLDGKTIDAMSFSAPDLYKDEDMLMTNLIFNQLCILYHKKNHTYRNKIVVNLTINYILEIYEQTHKHIKEWVYDTTNHRNFLIDRFYMLCREDHLIHRNIEYYANELNITSRYLYKICKESIQRTPKQCIDSMISGDAKKLLLTTTLTNQQIANELNFPDQSTFGQFFKRNVGMSPSEFRNKFK